MMVSACGEPCQFCRLAAEPGLHPSKVAATSGDGKVGVLPYLGTMERQDDVLARYSRIY
jgi:hypothetical protein